MSRQYIGNLGKVENGIVAVTAYGVIEGMTVMLDFEVYKPKSRLKKGESECSKPQLAAQMLRELKNRGFKFSLVLADSLYGESESNFINCLEELELEYGLKHTKNELGWADFRLTNYTDIQKWWQIVASAYLLVTLHSSALPTSHKPLHTISTTGLGLLLSEHHRWDFNTGWKSLLNNLRLILQPFVSFNLMKIWLKIFPIPELDVGFSRLIAFMNRFRGAIPTDVEQTDFHFSSA